MKAKFIYESLQFQRGGDPRQVLDIGQRVQIENWFKDIERQMGDKIDYTIDDKLNIIVKQNLDLPGLDITWLPDNLTVNVYLDLQHTKIFKLPDNLTVKKYLDIRDTNIIKLPDSLRVERNIYISKDMVENLVVPEHLKTKIREYF